LWNVFGDALPNTLVTIEAELAEGSTELGAALTVGRRLRMLVDWPRIMAEAREAADGSTSAATHRLHPADYAASNGVFLA
jgi:hypothetical protein